MKGKENWRWNQNAHYPPRQTSIQVIESADPPPPRRQPYGFAPPEPRFPHTPVENIFPPQIAARRRI